MPAKPTYEELEQRVKELEKQTANRTQGEKALQASEDIFKAISASAQDCIIMITDFHETAFP